MRDNECGENAVSKRLYNWSDAIAGLPEEVSSLFDDIVDNPVDPSSPLSGHASTKYAERVASSQDFLAHWALGETRLLSSFEDDMRSLVPYEYGYNHGVELANYLLGRLAEGQFAMTIEVEPEVRSRQWQEAS